VIFPSRFAGAALACATLLLSACMTTPPRETVPAVPAADQPFAIDGRLSAKRGADGAAANFAWNHEAARDRIDFASPFGQVYARIDGNDDRVLVERPGGFSESYPDWRSMTIALLGAPVPVDDLAFWIRGAARAGTAASVERDAQGRAFRTTRRLRVRPALCSSSRTSNPSRFALSWIAGAPHKQCPECRTIDWT
jgi:outer membrane lipoprotein LolB